MSNKTKSNRWNLATFILLLIAWECPMSTFKILISIVAVIPLCFAAYYSFKPDKKL